MVDTSRCEGQVIPRVARGLIGGWIATTTTAIVGGRKGGGRGNEHGGGNVHM
jgi:hypothetical protein